MRYWVIGLTVFVCSSGGVRGERAPIETLLPANTPFAVIVDDMIGLMNKLDGHPFKRVFEDSEIQAFLGPMFEEMDGDGFEAGMAEGFEEMFGVTFEEYKEYFKGQAALAFYIPPGLSFEDFADMDTEDFPFKAMLLIDVNENEERVRELEEKSTETHEERLEEAGLTPRHEVEEVGGEEVFLGFVTDPDGNEYPGGGYTIIDGWYVNGFSHEVTLEMAHRLSNQGDDEALADSELFQDVARESEGNDALVFVNLESVMGFAKEAIEEFEAESPERVNPAVPSPGVFFDALGLGDLRSFYGAVNLSETQTDLDFGLTYSQRSGLMNLLAFVEGEVDPVDFIPEDAASVSVTLFSVRAFYDAIILMANSVQPMISGMAMVSINQAIAPAGVDFERDIIDAFDERYISATLYKASAEPGANRSFNDAVSLTMIQLKDPARFEKTVMSLLNMAGVAPMLEKNDFLGTTVYSMPTPDPDTPEVAMAFTDEYLMMATGSADAIRQVLVMMDQGGASIWEDPDVAPGLEAMRGGASSIGYVDLGVILGDVATMFEDETVRSLLENGTDMPFDLSALPSRETLEKYFGKTVSAYYVREFGQFNKTRFIHSDLDE